MTLARAVPDDWTPRGKGHRPLGRVFAPHRFAGVADVLELPEAAPEVAIDLEILDQGGVGTCDPVSLGHCVEADYVRRGLPAVRPSARAHYRRICEAQNVIADLGSDPVIALDTLAEWGFPSEAQWPYTDRLDPAKPELEGSLLERLPADVAVQAWSQRDAARLDYAVVAGRGDGEMLFLRRLLTSRRLVQICILVDGAFERGAFDPSKPLAPPAGGGGHAMALSGYKVVNGAIWWRVDNQWSTAFGLGGRLWFSDAYVRSAMCLAYVKQAPVIQ